MSRVDHQDLRIGTMAGKADRTAPFIAAVAHHGFESYEINFWQQLPDKPLKQLAAEINQVLDTLADRTGSRPVVSSVSFYGNPLDNKEHAAGWRKLIDAAELFGAPMVSGFAGGAVGQSVPDSIRLYKKVFEPLAQRAADKGLQLGFENCTMGSTWNDVKMNIAYCPAAWELMYDAVPAENIGLVWEPCHQMTQLIDPLPQLRKWAGKVIRLHGKDATIKWDVLREQGNHAGKQIVQHRTPGFGDTNWTDVFSILREAGFVGCCDIEGYHDPVYKGDLEMTGQIHALEYLKRCRGGTYHPMPQGF